MKFATYTRRTTIPSGSPRGLDPQLNWEYLNREQYRRNGCALLREELHHDLEEQVQSGMDQYFIVNFSLFEDNHPGSVSESLRIVTAQPRRRENHYVHLFGACVNQQVNTLGLISSIFELCASLFCALGDSCVCVRDKAR